MTLEDLKRENKPIHHKLIEITKGKFILNAPIINFFTLHYITLHYIILTFLALEKHYRDMQDIEFTVENNGNIIISIFSLCLLLNLFLFFKCYSFYKPDAENELLRQM
jgi:hypothetical protein